MVINVINRIWGIYFKGIPSFSKRSRLKTLLIQVNTLPFPEILPFLTLYVLLAIIQIFSAILNLALLALLFFLTSSSEAITGFLVIALNGFKEFP